MPALVRCRVSTQQGRHFPGTQHPSARTSHRLRVQPGCSQQSGRCPGPRGPSGTQSPADPAWGQSLLVSSFSPLQGGAGRAALGPPLGDPEGLSLDLLVPAAAGKALRHSGWEFAGKRSSPCWLLIQTHSHRPGHAGLRLSWSARDVCNVQRDAETQGELSTRSPAGTWVRRGDEWLSVLVPRELHKSSDFT